MKYSIILLALVFIFDYEVSARGILLDRINQNVENQLCNIHNLGNSLLPHAHSGVECNNDPQQQPGYPQQGGFNRRPHGHFNQRHPFRHHQGYPNQGQHYPHQQAYPNQGQRYPHQQQNQGQQYPYQQENLSQEQQQPHQEENTSQEQQQPHQEENTSREQQQLHQEENTSQEQQQPHQEEHKSQEQQQPHQEEKQDTAQPHPHQQEGSTEKQQVEEPHQEPVTHKQENGDHPNQNEEILTEQRGSFNETDNTIPTQDVEKDQNKDAGDTKSEEDVMAALTGPDLILSVQNETKYLDDGTQVTCEDPSGGTLTWIHPNQLALNAHSIPHVVVIKKGISQIIFYSIKKADEGTYSCTNGLKQVKYHLHVSETPQTINEEGNRIVVSGPNCPPGTAFDGINCRKLTE